MQIKDLTEAVRRFKAGAGHELLEEPGIPDEKRIRLAAMLVAEEAFETLRAIYGDAEELAQAETFVRRVAACGQIEVDLSKIADGCVDLLYVTEGMLQDFGVRTSPLFAEVHAANLSKLSREVRKDATGKTLKHEGWRPPDVEGVLRAQGWRGGAPVLVGEGKTVQPPSSGRGEDPTEGVTPAVDEVISALLLVVEVDGDLLFPLMKDWKREIATWGDDERQGAHAWAISVHLRAADNEVDAVPMPACVLRLPARPGESALTRHEAVEAVDDIWASSASVSTFRVTRGSRAKVVEVKRPDWVVLSLMTESGTVIASYRPWHWKRVEASDGSPAIRRDEAASSGA